MNVIYTYENPTPPKDILAIQKCLENGGVMAYPTDVNWAFGCLATHKKALKRLKKLRKTPDSAAPLALMFRDISQVSNYTQLNNQAFRLIRKLLPGPYTILLKPHPRLTKLLPSKRPDVGIRIPQRPILMDILQHLACPLATTTAFLPKKSSKDHNNNNNNIEFQQPTSSYSITEHFAHEIDLLVDLSIEIHLGETTVISLSDSTPQLIRQGVAPFELG